MLTNIDLSLSPSLRMVRLCISGRRHSRIRGISKQEIQCWPQTDRSICCKPRFVLAMKSHKPVGGRWGRYGLVLNQQIITWNTALDCYWWLIHFNNYRVWCCGVFKSRIGVDPEPKILYKYVLVQNYTVACLAVESTCLRRWPGAGLIEKITLKFLKWKISAKWFCDVEWVTIGKNPINWKFEFPTTNHLPQPSNNFRRASHA